MQAKIVAASSDLNAILPMNFYDCASIVKDKYIKRLL